MAESIKPIDELETITNKVELTTLENLRNGTYDQDLVTNFIENEERSAKYIESDDDVEMRQKLIDGGSPAKSRAKAQGYKNALEKFRSKK